MTTDWMRRGACIGEDPELFHSQSAVTMTLAKKVCQQCPVVARCLDYALTRMTSERTDCSPETAPIGQYGVWGNTLPNERWRIINRRPTYQGGVHVARAS